MRSRLNTDSFSRRNQIPAITGIVQARRNGALEKQAAGHIPAGPDGRALREFKASGKRQDMV